MNSVMKLRVHKSVKRQGILHNEPYKAIFVAFLHDRLQNFGEIFILTLKVDFLSLDDLIFG